LPPNLETIICGVIPHSNIVSAHIRPTSGTWSQPQ